MFTQITSNCGNMRDHQAASTFLKAEQDFKVRYLKKEC